ncbi:MAG TPA: magnesium transporter CorA family protein [Bacteroidales bacterium]|nr:magnesium transporter CorA family protein [Bacteroidales bacterium]HNS46375.1 magnesium transporter CorA family protein [Bacteroidales bacterium]
MIETIKIGTIRWHHILDPREEDLNYLLETFYFHPLDIEDCKSYNQRPKIDIYDDYYFLILHFPNFDRWNRFILTREVKIFWGEDYVITIGQSHWVVTEMFKEYKQLAEKKEELEIGNSDTLLYRILERLTKETLSLVQKVGLEVEMINRDLFNKKAEKTIEKISLTRRNIILLNTTFKPQLRLFHKFESGEIEGYADTMEEYWGNILDYYQKTWDLTEDYAELIESLSKTFDSLQTNKTNEIIKILTMISSILLPLTFIASVYGMNLRSLPFSQYPNSFWILMGCMVVLGLLMVTYFKKRRWL